MPSQRVREAWAEAATEDAAGETAAPEAGANEKDTSGSSRSPL